MGYFLSFEGIDGVGKSTQAQILYQRLGSRFGRPMVNLFREPGSTEAGERIRQLLLLENELELTPLTQLLLFSAARVELIKTHISQAIMRDKWIILDRYVDSTIAYQCYGSGMDIDHVRIIQDIVVGGVMPALTFVLDMPPEYAAERLADRLEDDRFESQALAYQKRVREGYIRIANQYPSRCVMINAMSPEGNVADDIMRHIEQRLL